MIVRGCCVKTKQIVLRGNTHSCTFLSPGKHSNRTLVAFNVEIIGIGLSGAWQMHEIRREYMNADADNIQNERAPPPSFPRTYLF